jgi:hypothetical protein
MKAMSLLIAGLLGSCVMQTIAGEPAGKILAFGIFKQTETQLIKTPETPSGTTRILNDLPLLVASTNQIPARTGIMFGINFEISGLDLKDGDFVTITAVKTWPPIRKPDGMICGSNTSDFKLRVQNGKARGFQGYLFHEDYELVAGHWKMEVMLNGKTLIAQDFTVYKGE